MDGTFAVLTFALGLWGAHGNGCGDGCNYVLEGERYNSISAGPTLFGTEYDGQEIYFRRQTGKMHGPFQTIYGISATDTGDIWGGLGHAVTLQNDAENVFVQLHAMTGIYVQGDGNNLGGPIEFRSGIEFGYESYSGMRYAFSYDHRSNAGIYKSNSGMETIQFRVSVPVD